MRPFPNSRCAREARGTPTPEHREDSIHVSQGSIMCDTMLSNAGLSTDHTHTHTSEVTRSTCCNGSLLGSYGASGTCEWLPRRGNGREVGRWRTICNWRAPVRIDAPLFPWPTDHKQPRPAENGTRSAEATLARTHSLSPLPVPHTAARQRRQQQAPGVAGGSERCQRQNIPRCAALLSGRHQTRDAPSASGRRERGKRPAPRLAPPSACRASRSPVVQLGRHSLVWHLTRLPSPGTTSG